MKTISLLLFLGLIFSLFSLETKFTIEKVKSFDVGSGSGEFKTVILQYLDYGAGGGPSLIHYDKKRKYSILFVDTMREPIYII